VVLIGHPPQLLIIYKFMKFFKIKPGKEKNLIEWGSQLSGYLRDEALASLQEEKCSRESAYMVRIGRYFYLIGHMEGDHILPPTDRSVNKAHKSVMSDCLEKELNIIELYDLKP
jgi:hypothetical protein